MGRLKPLDLDALTADQKRIVDDVKTSRGGFDGPFAVWLRSPVLADRAQLLGQFVRFHTSLSQRLSELAILVTARLWTAQYEWHAHEKHARAAGLDPKIIEEIKAGRTPHFEREDERLIYEFTLELSRTRKISETTYQTASRHFGDVALVELVGILGYYTLIAMTLNAFDVDSPGGSPLSPISEDT